MEFRRVLAAAFQNSLDVTDVDNDGVLMPLDALAVINHIRRAGTDALPSTRPTRSHFVDVDGDGYSRPLDALLVINQIRRFGSGSISRTLQDTGVFLSETFVRIGTGQTEGTREYSFDLEATLAIPSNSASGDLFAVYVVDKSDSTKTLIDRGLSGSPIFTMTHSGYETTPGVTRFDGETLSIDLTSISEQQATIKLQLLNHDANNVSRVLATPISNTVDPDGTPSILLRQNRTIAAVGGEVDTNGLTVVSAASVRISQVQFTKGGLYEAEFTVMNEGDSIGRNTVVMFTGLPSEVSIENASGVTTTGVPYLNISQAIGSGGLGRNELSSAIPLKIRNARNLPFAVQAVVMTGQANRPPSLLPIADLTVSPGGKLLVKLAGQDSDGDEVRYSIHSASALPNATLLGDELLFSPAPSHIGNYEFDVVATDGSRSVTQPVKLSVKADSNVTTRVSGKIVDVLGRPINGVRVEVGNQQAITRSDGSFLLNFGNVAPTGDTLRIRAELLPGGKYPFIAEKLGLLLGHDLYTGFNNNILRPIYLPELNSGTTINPATDQTVTQQLAPNEAPAEVEVAAGTLFSQQGTPFTGQLSITEVPPNFTPVSLPSHLAPDSVVTIQPGEMTFATPTALSLPNRAGWPAGTTMDLWSINPTTGQFEIVGTSRVSADGKSIDTIEGGIRTSSWHMVAPPPPPENLVKGPTNDRNLDAGCPSCEVSKPLNSEVSLFTGGVTETHALVSYSSLGVDRSIVLKYDSLRADPRPIIHGGLFDAGPNTNVVMSVSVERDGVLTKMPGFVPESDAANRHFPELRGGEHFFRSPNQQGEAGYSLQLDLRDYPTGRYRYETSTGLSQTWVQTTASGDIDRISFSTRTDSDYLVHVNAINSPFGVGWGIAGLQQIFMNDDGSALLVDGDGSELLFPKSPSLDNQWLSPPGDFSKLVRRSDGTLLRTMKDQSRYEFDSQNRIESMTDRNGNVTRYQYLATNGFLEKITDPVGLVTSFVYANNKISSITDPAGRVTRFNHDSDGNLTGVTDPDNSRRLWSYDNGHRMTGETDQLGNVESAVYNSAGRVIEATLKDGAKIYVSPVQSQGLPESSSTDPRNPAQAKSLGAVTATYVDSRGFSSSTSLDRAGQMSGGEDGEGSLPGMTRNGSNLVTSTQSPRGNQSRLRYDKNGNLIQTSDSLSPEGSNLYEGTIEFAQQENQHALSITTATLVNFDRISQDTQLQLVHGDSQTIWYGSSGSDGSLLLYPGQYNLKVNRQTPGAYSFRLRSLEDASEMTAGSSQQVSFNNAGEAVAFRISANAFDRFAFTPLANSNAIQWKLLGPQVAPFFFASTNAVQSPTLNAADTYTLVLWRIDGLSTPLNFGFRVENLGNFPPPPATGQTIELGQTISGSVDDITEIDRYRFTISSSKRVLWDVQDSGAFSYALTGPVSNAGLSESFVPSILLPGEYQLSVTSTETGAYRFALLDLEAAEAIVPNTNVDGTLNPSNSSLAYRFTAEEGDRYYLSVLSNESIASGITRLIDPTGSVVWSINGLSDQEFTAQWKGDYLLLVEGGINESPEIDTFRIRLLEQTVRSQALAFGQLTTGSFVEIGGSQEYTFTLDSRTTIYYDDIGENTIYPSLWSEASLVTTFGAGGSIALDPGTYRFVFDPSGASLGEFSFKVRKLSEAPILSLGSPTAGTLNPFNSTNLYRFNATAGDLFFFDVIEDNDITQGNWSLLDAEGQIVFSQPFLDRQPTTMPRTGEYYLLIEGANHEQANDADAYIFNVEVRGSETAPSMVGDAKAFGELVSGELTEASEKHYFKFTLPTDSTVFLDSHSFTSLYKWDISSPTKLIRSDSFANDSEFIKLQAGQYQVAVESNGGIGTYEFRFLNLANASILTPGTPVSGTLSPSGEIDLYRFSATAGDRFYFDVLENNDIRNGSWGLIGPDGSQSWYSHFVDRPTETMPLSGMYTLVIVGRNDEGGDPDSYRINVEPLGTTRAPQVLGTTSAFGALINGELITSNEKQYYKFTLPRDGSVFFDSETYTGDFTWNLSSATDPIGSGTFFTDSSLFNLQAGDYQVSIESSGPVGAYAFRMHSLKDATALTPGTPVSGSLSPSNQSDVYRFNASAGEYYFFDVLEDRDISFGGWRLVRPDGVESWAQSFSDRAPELMTMSGQYSLIIDGRNDEGGNPDEYRINVEPRGTIMNPTVVGTATPFGALVTGELTATNRKRYYQYTLANESQVLFDSHSFSSSFEWSISSADRFIESSSFAGDSSILNLPAGQYQVSVESNDTTGPFEFRLSNLSVATLITPGTPVAGSLAPSNESDIYRINATAGDMVKFDILENRDISFGSWRLIAPNGQQVWNQPVMTRPVEVLEKTGQYYLIIDGRNDEAAGDDVYRINVEPRGTVVVPQVTGTAISIGSTVTGQINNANEKRYYKFSVPSSGLYVLDSLASGNNLVWEINSAREQLRTNVASQDSSVLQLEAGDYQVTFASVGSTGTFSFRLLGLDGGVNLATGDTMSGTINPVNETDVYRFAANAGDQFSFETLTQPASSTYWQLVSPSGRSLWNQFFGARSTETLLESGTYSLLVSGDTTSTGDYSFQVVSQGNQSVGFTGDLIVPGQVVSGEITANNDSISYRLNIANESYVFFDGIEGPNLSATINDVYGAVLQVFGLTNDGGPVKLRPGNYQVLVSGAGNTGPFSFRLVDNSVATQISLGALTTATIDSFDTVAFRFNANVGDRMAYNFHDMENHHGGETMHLVDPLGHVVWTSHLANDVVSSPLTRSGSYTLLLSSSNTNGGPGRVQFTLENRGSYATPIFAGTPLTLGQMKSEIFTDAVRGLLYKFSLPTASTIYVDMHSPSGQVVWNVYDSVRSLATSYGDSSSITLEAGEYQIGFEANSGQNSAFDFQVMDLANVTSVPLNSQTTINLRPQETKAYRFNAVAGDLVDIRTLSTDGFFNGAMHYQLIGPDGKLIETKQLFGGSPLEPLKQSGRYNLLIVRDDANDVPAKLTFALESRGTVASPSAFGTLITPGQPQQGELTESVRALYYRLTIPTATNILVDTLESNSIGWTLYGRDGSIAGSFGDSAVMRVAAGEYQLLFNSTGFETGTVSFQVLDLNASNVVTLGADTIATLDVNESRAYRFNATAGDRVALDIISTEDLFSSTQVQLIDPFGTVVFASSAFIGRTPATLDYSGTYSLLFTRDSQSGVAGEVVFNLQSTGTLQAPSAIGTQVSMGQVVQGILSETSKVLYHKFTLTSATKVLMDTLTGSVGWTLYGPSGRVASSSDDSDILELPAGTYQIVHQTFDSQNQIGSFSFQLLDLAVVPVIVPNAITSANLGLRESRAFRFEATAGDRVSLLPFSYPSGVFVQLIDPQAEVVWSGRAGENRPPMTLNTTGTYNLIVSRNESAGVASKFVFAFDRLGTLMVPQVPGVTIPIGQIQQGELTTAAPARYYKFVLPEATTVFIDTLTENNVISWSLRNARSTIAISIGDSTGMDLDAGEYSIVFWASELTATEKFSFKVLAHASAENIVANTTVTSPFGLRESKSFRFSAQAGERYFFDIVDSPGVNPFGFGTWWLEDPRGQILWHSTLADQGPMVLKSSGQYMLGIDRSQSSGVVAPLSFKVESAPFAQASELRLDSGGGQRMTYEGTFNKLTRAVDERGMVTSISVDPANGNVQSVTIAEGTPLAATATLAYNTRGQAISTTDALGRITEMEYNDLGRLVRQTRAKGTTIEQTDRFEYDAAGNLTASVDALGRRTETTFDALGRPLVIKDPLRGLTRFRYDARGNLISVTDPLGRVTRSTYDSRDRLLRTVFADGNDVEYRYDADGNRIAVTDERGNTTRTNFDSRSRPESIVQADGSVYTTVYDADNNPTQLIDALGRVTRREYDLRGRNTRTINALGEETTTTFDANGNVLSVVDRGVRTSFEYDIRNRMIARVDADPDGTGPLAAPRTQYVYDAVDNLIQTIDPLGRVTRMEYDALNRLVRTIDPRDAETRYGYDEIGNLKVIIDSVGNRTSFRYDVLDRLVEETDPSGAKKRFEYDAVGNLVKRTDRNGRVTTYEYDSRNRLLKETWVGGDHVIEHTYEPDGTLKSIVDKSSALEFTFDSLNRTSSVEDTLGVRFQYTYDANGNTTAVSQTISSTIASSPIATNTAFTFDALNRMQSVAQTGTGITAKRAELAYTNNGMLASISRFAAATGGTALSRTDWTYDGLRRFDRIAHKNGAGTTISNFDFDFDVASQLTKQTHSRGVVEYGYDAASQVISATYSDAAFADETYGFDANGNRTSTHVNATGHQTGVSNRQQSDGKYNYVYDAEGNLIRRTAIVGGAIREFTWDYRNRLTAVTDKNADGVATKTSRYSYDAMNRRITESVDETPNDAIDAAILYFVYDREDIVTELLDSDGNGPLKPAVRTQYMHGPGIDQVLAKETSGATEWLLTDHLGSTVLVVNSSGAQVASAHYDSFGNTIASTGTIGRFGYTGRELDTSTGLYYYRARYYDPAMGRFISEDPIGFEGGDTNLQRYVGNDTLRSIDPTGLVWDTVLDIGFILFDVYTLAKDNVFGHCDNLGENLTALGLDVLGALVPVATGLGAASRLGKVSRAVNSGDEVVDVVLKGSNGGIRKVTNSVTRTVDDVNAEFVAKGFNPPYAGTNVREFVTGAETQFVRVHGPNNRESSWMMRADEIQGLTPAQIKDKFALPAAPTMVSDVHVPVGTKIRAGKVAPQPGWGQGGAMQYELLDRLPEGSFKNTRGL